MDESVERLETILPELSSALRRRSAQLAAYSRQTTPQIVVLAAHRRHLNPWRQAWEESVPADWTVHEHGAEGSEEAETGAEERWPELAFCDFGIVVTTALHLAPRALVAATEAWRALDKKVFVVLTQLRQVRARDDLIRRKMDEARKAFDLSRASVYACIETPRPGVTVTCPFDTAVAAVIGEVTEQWSLERERQTGRLGTDLLSRALSEVRVIRRQQQAARRILNEETEITRNTMDSLVIRAQALAEVFHLTRTNLLAGLSDLDPIPLVPDGDAEHTPGEESWTEAYRHALRQQFHQRLDKLRRHQPLAVAERLEHLFDQARDQMESNIESLSRHSELSQLDLEAARGAVQDVAHLSALCERCRNLEHDWWPLDDDDIESALDHELDGLSFRAVELWHKLSTQGTETADGEPRRITLRPARLPPGESPQTGAGGDDPRPDPGAGGAATRGPLQGLGERLRELAGQHGPDVRERLERHLAADLRSAVVGRLLGVAEQRLEHDRRQVIDQWAVPALRRHGEQVLAEYRRLAAALRSRQAPIRDFVEASR